MVVALPIMEEGRECRELDPTVTTPIKTTQRAGVICPKKSEAGLWRPTKQMSAIDD